MARTSLLSIVVLGFVIATGCNKENNSPDMGAVPPKPNPDVVKNMPPQLQEQMKNVDSGLKQQVNDMGKTPNTGK